MTTMWVVVVMCLSLSRVLTPKTPRGAAVCQAASVRPDATVLHRSHPGGLGPPIESHFSPPSQRNVGARRYRRDMAEQHDVVTATDVAAMRHALQRLDPTVPADTAGGSVIAAGTAGGGVGAPAAGATTGGVGTPAAGTAGGGVGVPAPVADPARGGHGLSQAQCIDLLRELEALKAAAAEAAVTAHLARSRRAAEEAAGVPARHRGRGLAAEVALARRVSPHRGGRHLGLATTLSADMPNTLAALRSGRLSEWRATLLVRESICLGPAERRAVDEELCADLATVDAWGDRRLVAEARRVAYRLAPHSVVERARRAEGERCVTLRPAPDTMAYLTALLP